MRVCIYARISTCIWVHVYRLPGRNLVYNHDIIIMFTLYNHKFVHTVDQEIFALKIFRQLNFAAFNFRHSSPATKIKHGDLYAFFIDFTVLSLTCFPSFLEICCAMLISVLRNLATLKGAEFHVRASLVAFFLPDPRLLASAIAREGTLANSEPRGSGSPYTGTVREPSHVLCGSVKF